MKTTLIGLLSSVMFFLTSCQHISTNTKSYSVGQSRYLSTGCASTVYDLVLSGEITTVEQLLANCGKVLSYKTSEGFVFPVLSRELAENYDWYYNNKSKRFCMNYGVLRVKASQNGGLLRVSLEYESDDYLHFGLPKDDEYQVDRGRR